MLQRLLLALMLGLAACGPVRGLAQAGTAYDPEAYLRERLLAGQDVDLSQRCRDVALGASDKDAKTETCGSVSGSGFAKLLRDKTIVQALPAHGLVLTGIHVRDAVELRWTDIAENIVCRRCQFDGRLVLEGASFDHGLRFEQSKLMGGIDGRASRVRGRVSFVDGTTVAGDVDFSTATLSDMLETDGAAFDGRFDVSKAKLGLVRLADTTFVVGIQADDTAVGGTLTLDDRTQVLGKGLVARGMSVGSYFKFGERSARGAKLGTTSKIAGLNLTSGRLEAGLEIGNTRVGSASEVVDDERFTTAGLVLVGANIEGALRIDGATIAGAVDADGVNIAKGLQSRRTEYEAEVSLKHASIGGDLEIADRSLLKLTAEKLHVGGSLELLDIGAQVLDLKGASIDADVDLLNVKVTGASSGDEKSMDSLDLDQASIGKHLALEGSTTVTGKANFAGMSTSDLVIGITPPQKPAVRYMGLSTSNSVTEDLAQKAARVCFLDEAEFSRIKVANSVFLRSVSFGAKLLFIAADIKAHLDIATADIGKLDMTRASVGGDFRLALSKEERKAHPPIVKTDWGNEADLKLDNAHVGVIQDENEDMGSSAWPPKVELQGFGYDRFGQAPTYDIAKGWLGKDVFSAGPYLQLAKYYTDAGDKEDANSVLVQAKWNETIDAWKGCVSPDPSACAHAVGLTALGLLIYYGIGNGLFVALLWVGVLALIGAWCLRWTRDENQEKVKWGGPGKGFFWCVGASANHLIPLVELNSEFKRFFDDPKRERLSSRQLTYFAAHAVMGYVLASFVVAAIGGLTQSH